MMSFFFYDCFHNWAVSEGRQNAKKKVSCMHFAEIDISVSLATKKKKKEKERRRRRRKYS